MVGCEWRKAKFSLGRSVGFSHLYHIHSKRTPRNEDELLDLHSSVTPRGFVASLSHHLAHTTHIHTYTYTPKHTHGGRRDRERQR